MTRESVSQRAQTSNSWTSPEIYFGISCVANPRSDRAGHRMWVTFTASGIVLKDQDEGWDTLHTVRWE